jgi:hypothetical protein
LKPNFADDHTKLKPDEVRSDRNQQKRVPSFFDREASQYPGMLKNNFVDLASFKAASVWNCDWKFNTLPDMHIKFVLIFMTK